MSAFFDWFDMAGGAWPETVVFHLSAAGVCGLGWRYVPLVVSWLSTNRWKALRRSADSGQA